MHPRLYVTGISLSFYLCIRIRYWLTLWGVPSFAMFCYVLSQKFQLPIGFHSSCSAVSDQWLEKHVKQSDWEDAPHCRGIKLYPWTRKVCDIFQHSLATRGMGRCRSSCRIFRRINQPWIIPAEITLKCINALVGLTNGQTDHKLATLTGRRFGGLLPIHIRFVVASSSVQGWGSYFWKGI